MACIAEAAWKTLGELQGVDLKLFEKPYPLTQSYYENDSLRIIFRNFWGNLRSQNLWEKEDFFSRNYAWNSKLFKNK